MEAPSEQADLPFLDTLVSVESNSSLITSVYRKPTHTVQYLHWDSHHSISIKYNIYNTLTHWARTLCSDWVLLEQEQQHIRIALSRYSYPDWVFHRLQTKLDTIKDLLVVPKDEDNMTSKGGVVYRYKCHHLGCSVEYTGETGRTFGDRYKEHLRVTSLILHHANTSHHPIWLDNFSIMDRESQWATRTIKEDMFIRLLHKYQLRHILNDVL